MEQLDETESEFLVFRVSLAVVNFSTMSVEAVVVVVVVVVVVGSNFLIVELFDSFKSFDNVGSLDDDAIVEFDDTEDEDEVVDERFLPIWLVLLECITQQYYMFINSLD